MLRRRIKYSSSLLLSFALILCVNVAFASSMISLAPQNTSFIDYLQKKQSLPDQKHSMNPSSVREGGVVPMPVDFSHLRFADCASFLKDPSPVPVSYSSEWSPTYDLRVQNRLTDVRDQKPFGAHWAFGALASMESIHKKSTGKLLDLSETHLAWSSYADSPRFTQSGASHILNEGGHILMAAAVLSRPAGAVLEEALPYPVKGQFVLPSRPAGSYSPALRLRDVYLLGFDARSSDNMLLKKMIVQEGAVAISLEYTDTFFNVEKSSYYHAGFENVDSVKHMVTLVGWDDHYPKENFLGMDTPSVDGAWLARSSWGPNWGDGGYFWVSYDDATLQEASVFIPDNEKARHDTVYAHDPLGMTATMGDGDQSLSMFAANRFVAREDSSLQSVSFYTTDANAQYEIAIYKDVSSSAPVSGNRVGTVQKGSKDFAGYHTVKLEKPVSLAKGDSFSIIMKFTNSVYPYPIAIEHSIMGYSDAATSAPGQSFVSVDGVSWVDLSLSEKVSSGNVTIKAFAKRSTGSENTFHKSTSENDTSKQKGVENRANGCSAFGGVAFLLPALFLMFRRKG